MSSSNIDLKIANEAFERYASVVNEIDRVKDGISSNRHGETPLTAISSNPTQLAERIAREGLPLDQALERINGVPNFQDIVIIKRIFRMADSVGRITVKNQYGTSGYGTGFLIAPGVILTNNHVFPDPDTAAKSYIQFNYELNPQGEPSETSTFALKPDKLFITSSFEKKSDDSFSGLDFAIVAVDDKSKEGKRIDEIPFVRLDENRGKITEGENCIIIQHPKGDYKKIVLKDIRMITLTDDFLIYESDTLPGSSGAMVIGMGTGEVIALHHSGVPKKDARGQWLRKDGSVYKPSDDPDSIEWIGNEGVRVSRILKTVRDIKIPDHMQSLRDTVLNLQAPVKNQATTTPIRSTNESDTITRAVNILSQATHESDLEVQYFEIELSSNLDMQDHWKENFRTLVKGIVSSEAVFPMSTDPIQRRMFYLTIRSEQGPWQLAAELEALPQITTATPDLEMDTDLQVQKHKHSGIDKESYVYESYNDGTADWNESDFISNWSGCEYFNGSNNNDPGELMKMRKWNAIAIGADKLFQAPIVASQNGNGIHAGVSKAEWVKNLTKIKLVQLDTGYTDHSKTNDGFDLDNDEDFVDGEDARDEMSAGVLKYPGHGTRTASLIVGNTIANGSFKADGNCGILRDNTGSQYAEMLEAIKVVPYRIAQSVILIGKGKNLVDAANHAINSNADVMFMCMGSYPRPMLYEMAKAVYDMGVIWICAAGNEVEMVVAPALYPGTIAVAASNPRDRPWKGSSYGPAVDISAPGEDVYVPFYNKNFEEIMVYGSGSSYAAPQVASAAVLWKAKHYEQLFQRYTRPWQIVEAFRHCLRESAKKPANWDTGNYGQGILNIPALLNIELPNAGSLQYAYGSKPVRPEWDLGIRETVHSLWKTLISKVTPGPESTSSEMILTERARISVSALSASTPAEIFESHRKSGKEKASKILDMYFGSYQ